MDTQDLTRRDAAAREARHHTLTTVSPSVPPLPFDVDALVRSIQQKIDAARASRDQAEMTRRTMVGIDVAAINPAALNPEAP